MNPQILTKPSHLRNEAQPMSQRRFGILKRQRLRREQEFSHVYQSRMSVSNPHLLVYAALNNLGLTRFGLSVSRKHGNAVNRNRIKRLLREAFRLTQHKLPQGLDLILIPKQNSDANLKDYQSAVVSLSQKLQERWLKVLNCDG